MVSNWDNKYTGNRRYKMEWELEHPWLSLKKGNSYCNACKRVITCKKYNLIAHEKSIKHQKNMKLFDFNKNNSDSEQEEYAEDPTTLKMSMETFELLASYEWLEKSEIPDRVFCSICMKTVKCRKDSLQRHSQSLKHKMHVREQSDKCEALYIVKHDQPVVDLCSDSHTLPCNEMMEAMASADLTSNEVVTELEAKVTTLLNKPCALFLPNGKMANLIAVLSHCHTRGSLVVAGDQSYIYKGLKSSITELGSIEVEAIGNLPDGTLNMKELSAILHNRPCGEITVVCVENTHARLGGTVVDGTYLKKLMDTYSKHEKVLIHMDGARLINASVTCNVPLGTLARYCSSVTLSFERGLGVIGGCVLAGGSKFIEIAHRLRAKLCVDDCKQSRFLAAGCLYAMEYNFKRIPQDHENAGYIAKAVSNCNSACITVDLERVQSNIVILNCDNIRVWPDELVNRLENVTLFELSELDETVSIKSKKISDSQVRLVTNANLCQSYVKLVVKKLIFVVNYYEAVNRI